MNETHLHNLPFKYHSSTFQYANDCPNYLNELEWYSEW